MSSAVRRRDLARAPQLRPASEVGHADFRPLGPGGRFSRIPPSKAGEDIKGSQEPAKFLDGSRAFLWAGKISLARRAAPAHAGARLPSPGLLAAGRVRGGWEGGRGCSALGPSSSGGRARGAGVTSCPPHPVAVCRIARDVGNRRHPSSRIINYASSVQVLLLLAVWVTADPVLSAALQVGLLLPFGILAI